MRYRNDLRVRSAHTYLMTLTPDLTIADILAAQPKALRVLLRHRMLCVGCLMARFETVHDAAAVYGLDERELLDEIERERAT